MSCTPGDPSSSSQRTGRRRFVTNASPTRGNSRFTATLVCSALAYSPTSPTANANRSTTCPPSTSTTRKRPPEATWTARASPAGTRTNSFPMGSPAAGGRPSFPFAGIPSFLGSAVCTDLSTLDADVAVLGAPTDEGSPFMPGSRFGARSIREHSLRFVTDGRGYYDPEARKQYLEREMLEGRIADVGDADILPTNVVDTFANITELTRAVLDRGAMPVVLGGDHSITF